jgi:2'-5' RNA ligase
MTAQDLHITLVFLGATTAEQIAVLQERMRTIARSLRAFAYTLGGPRLFPDTRRPRVLALEPRESSGFAAWQAPLAASCAELGFPREPWPYRPHLSLARLRGVPSALPAASGTLAGTACEVVLFQSRGGHYHALFSVAVEQS